jgi:hypothetical protein
MWRNCVVIRSHVSTTGGSDYLLSCISDGMPVLVFIHIAELVKGTVVGEWPYCCTSLIITLFKCLVQNLEEVILRFRIWVSVDILPPHPLWRCDPMLAVASSLLRFLDHKRRTTVARSPLDEWSARSRDLRLTTHNIHNRHSCHSRDSNPQSQQVGGRRPMS